MSSAVRFPVSVMVINVSSFSFIAVAGRCWDWRTAVVLSVSDQADDRADLASGCSLELGHTLHRDADGTEAIVEPLLHLAHLGVTKAILGDHPNAEPIEFLLDHLALEDKRKADEDAVEADQLAAVRSDDDVLYPPGHCLQDRE